MADVILFPRCRVQPQVERIAGLWHVRWSGRFVGYVEDVGGQLVAYALTGRLPARPWCEACVNPGYTHFLAGTVAEGARLIVAEILAATPEGAFA